MATDFSPMVQAGLTKTEFASLLNVTRVTVHRWIEDRKEPTPHLRKAVDELLMDITKAIDLGLFPGPLDSLPPSRHTMEDRLLIIAETMARVRSA